MCHAEFMDVQLSMHILFLAVRAHPLYPDDEQP